MSHAMLSPSSAERWIHCPPSARINAEAGDRETAYTKEGTQAHAVAEYKARLAFLGKSDFMPAPWPTDMDGYTDTYLEALKDIYAGFDVPPHVGVEVRVDLSEYVPGCFGTCDCLMIGRRGDGPNVLHVVDFKYGQGVAVAAKANPQMMLYALGALQAYESFYTIGQIEMTIVQPRIKAEPDTWTISPAALYEWANLVVAPTAALAAKGEGEYAEGDWCRFCAIRGSCRARAEANLRAAQMEFRPPAELTEAEIGEAITLGQRLKGWLSDIEDYALSACLAGREIPGYKAVAGRAVRAWTDAAAAMDAAKGAGVPEEMLYERKPVTLAQLEKIMGRKSFADALGAYVATPPGKPTLARQDDKRPAITGKTTAEDDFEEA